VLNEGKKAAVIMNAATSIITTRSPFFVRTSVPLPAAMGALATWGATKGGVKNAYTMVSDYGPGIDSEGAFQTAFKAASGNTVGAAVVNAMKGAAWESPRGPVSIDPETRDIIQTIYIRRVEKVAGKLQNVEFDKIEKVKDPVKERMKGEGKLNPDGTVK